MADDPVPNLAQLVLDKINALGDEAPEFFDVSKGTVAMWKGGVKPPTLAAAQKVFADLWTQPVASAPVAQIVEAVAAPEPEGTAPAGAVTLLMPIMAGLAPETFTTLFRACKLYGMDKISIIPKWRTLIVEARNDLAKTWETKIDEWCIFLDADGVFPCGSATILKKIGYAEPGPDVKANRSLITRLMSHPADKLIVGALYKDRRGGTRAQCESAFRSPQENERLLGFFTGKTVGDGLEKQGWVGFSAVRIHRSVFQRMKAAAVPGGPLEEIAPPADRPNDAYGYFDTTRVVRGEDVKFCRRAGLLGIDVWLDTGCLCGHLGEKIFFEMETIEQWRDVAGYEGCYQAGILGNIKSVERMAKNHGGMAVVSEKIRRTRVNKKTGYVYIRLSLDGIRKTFVVHRLIALAWLPNPEGLRDINHKNGIKTDNRIENLEWCSRSQNIKHAYATGLHKPRRGSQIWTNKLNEQQVLEIFHAKGMHKDIASKYGVKTPCVWSIKNKRIWKYLTVNESLCA